MKRISLIALALILAFALFAEESKPEIIFPDHHLCLEASGKVVVQADQAVFSFDTQGYGATLREAVRKAKDNVAQICGDLTKLGIDPSSFATGSFMSGKSGLSSFFTEKKDYAATLSTTVTLKDMSKLDEAILTLTDKKVENLSDVRFLLSDYSAPRQQAREIALNRIAEQRNTITRSLGIKITDVQLIDEAPFENLPWDNNQQIYYKANYPNQMNSVTQYERMDDMDGQMVGTKQAFFSPEVIVETQIRVIYRIGMASEK